MINYLFSSPLVFVVYAFSFLVALTIHEFSHAYASDYLGDPTARLAGRLSLNPFVHLDLVGAAFLLIFGFGWGKPVPVDVYNLKNPKKDSAIISFAGPLSNFILALILAILLRLLTLVDLGIFSTIGIIVFTSMIRINLILGIFNLIPVSPLDGFKIVGGFLSDEKAREWYSLERLGWLFLLILMVPFFGNSLLDNILTPAVSFIYNLLLPASLKIGGIV